MTQLIQLDFFRSPEECEQIAMREQIARLKESQDKQRKAQFARIGEIKKEVIEMRHEFEMMKRNICRSN